MASTGEPYGLFWNSENGDRTYDANSFEYWLKKFFTSGVFNGDLQVTATSGMTVQVGSGYANVDGKVKFWNAEFNLTLSPANSTYPRIDTIVITRDNVNREITCEVVTGAYSGDTPSATAPVRNAETYQLVLAQIYIANGATEVTQANITDTRPDTTLCGYITGTVTEMDFSQFTAQFEQYFTEFKNEHETEWSTWETTQVAAYNAWFANVQSQQVADKASWDAWYADLQDELHNLPSDSAEYLQVQIDEIRNSGTTGSIFHITTTNSELEGKTVTVSCGTETRTATFDSNLECTVIGFKTVGAVTITSTDGIQTATTTINIQYYSKYEVSISFFEASITVTYPSGATCTCVGGSSESYTASGSPYTFTVHSSGTYTITATDGTATDTETVSITTSGQSESVTLTFVPDGSTVTPTDDIQTWLHCADIFDKNYTTISQVLADASTVQALVASDNAVDYMVRSITWSSDVTADSSAMTYIGLDDYCADSLLSNSTWLNAICNSTYFESVLNVKVPTMTSNTAPSGTVIYSTVDQSDTSGHAAYKAFDGTSATWVSKQPGSVGDYVGYTFTSPVCVKKIVTTQAYNRNSAIKYQATNGSTWEDISEVITVPTGTNILTTIIDNNNKYSKYRLYITGLGSDSTYGVSTTELQFYGRA